jgi:hypothetical protein
MLILDKELNQKDTVRLYMNEEKRIPSSIKADLEAISAVKDSNTPCLLLLGSGSKKPSRDSGWLINPSTKARINFSLDTFYSRISRRGIEEINIEGMVRTGNNIILSNRGNKTHRSNHLIITSSRFIQEQSTAPLKMIRLGGQSDTAFFAGVSGLEYSAKSDMLIMTISTENTYNNIADGEIGKSYLWFITDWTSKTRMTAINPSRIIDLEAIDERLAGQKIESVCIVAETRNWMEVVVVSDNDNGESQLFWIKIPK